MLFCELEVLEARDVIIDSLLNDIDLMDEIEAEIEEYSQPLYKLLSSQLDADISSINLEVYNDITDIKVYSGKANLYPYDYESPVTDYHIYNIDNQVYIDVWCTFPGWRNIEVI